MIRPAPSAATWRQSSEPIEPPAPVTSTVAPVTYEAIEGMSSSTASRPRTSSTCTSRSWPERLKSPAMSSCTPGTVFTGTLASRHAFTIR